MSGNASKRVLMAMSGGVDSSVAALMLAEQGYVVEGMTMRLFSNDDVELSSDSSCCSLDDVEDARNVCLGLGIPHIVYNLSAAFGKQVIERFCAGYANGSTPNPCIDCNRYIKFDELQRRRRLLGFDYVATGHYARRAFNEQTGRFELKRAVDLNKDQSYVLYHLTQDTLAHMLFPLGNLRKEDVRAQAQSHGFANASKQESQDICFVPDGDYAGFIERRTGMEIAPGPVTDRRGKVLGKHAGLVHYTLGQRKGLGIAAGEPLYVFAKDVGSNTLVVDTDSNTLCTSVEIRDVNFIAYTSLEQPRALGVKCHYRQQPQPATVAQTDDDIIRVTFEKPHRVCAPGQAAVVYDGDTVVCGGTIASTTPCPIA